ncbi:MAG: TA system VapC family ribonuclease toxin, partial [Myxococcota bacterium]
CAEHAAACAFLRDHADDADLVICELVLVELYVLLRNPVVVERPLSAPQAAQVVHGFRSNPRWVIVESAQGVMGEVWRRAEKRGFARRAIFDARLALTLRHHGVTELATRNVGDFQGFGFERVWDPVEV